MSEAQILERIAQLLAQPANSKNTSEAFSSRQTAKTTLVSIYYTTSDEAVRQRAQELLYQC